MEIIKLNDKMGELHPQSEVFVITNLKQGVKNPNRVNVFVNDKFMFSLDVAQVVDYKLKIGLEISEERLEELKKASEFGKLYQRALEWVLVRPRSKREVQDYLRKKLYKSTKDYLEDSSELLKQIIARLTARGYIDDRKFAEFYVENRFVKKGVSKKRLKMELIKKGVGKDVLDEVLDGRDDEEEIRKMIKRKRAKYNDEKLTAYLCRQGFSYDLVREMIAKEND